MEINLDVFFLENLVMDYLILLVTSRFIKRKTPHLRMFLGALIGGLYASAMILSPSMKMLFTTFSRIAVSCVMVAVTFAPRRLAEFLKTLAIFYVSAFIFGGAAFAFLYFSQNGGFLKNGIIGLPLRLEKTLTLVFSVIAVGIIIRIFWEVIQYRFVKEKLLVPLWIRFEDKETMVAALVDTGNSLQDPLTRMPVVVVEYSALKELLPAEIRGIYDESKDSDLERVVEVISRSKWFSRFRLIPFSSLGRENGMMIGFKPDRVEIGEEQEKKGVRDVIIGIYNRALSKNEKYKALLGPELV